jgi:glycolate oxidase
MEDVGVPRDRVPDCSGRSDDAVAHGVAVATYGHRRRQLHPHFISSVTPDDRRAVRAIRRDLYLAAVELGGTVTAEQHGSTRVDFLEAQVGAGAVGVMQRIRSALDPAGLFNPGRGIPTARKAAGPAATGD